MSVSLATLRGMIPGPPSGNTVAQVTCRHCGRRVHIDPERVPAKSHERLRCTSCGHRGADIQFVWLVGPLPKNVVMFRRKRP